jgi:tartrate-resistant acid phosphatase type 5
LDYAKMPGTRWTMPAQFYRFEFPQINPQVTFIALDSNVPIPGKPAPSGFYTMSEEQRQQQLAWLEAELQKPLNTPYLAVMAHHPVYSDGPHGDHPVLIKDWDPLLREYNVHLYIAGHDHDMQHLEFEGHPTSFLLSGGGGAGLYPVTTDPAKRGPMALSVHGFSHLEAKREWLTLRHVDAAGNIIHAFRKYRDSSVTVLT